VSLPEVTRSDRRQFERRNMKEMTWIFNPGTGDLVECFVLNISAVGASLEALGADALPDRLHLLMLSEEYSLECDVKWRSKTSLGVTFV
jgi:hypothetical protein